MSCILPESCKFALICEKVFLFFVNAHGSKRTVILKVFTTKETLSENLKPKPRTDEQFFHDNFSLTSFICSCVRLKIDKFSFTRSLGNLFVCTAVKEKWFVVHTRIKLVNKLVKEKLLVCTGLYVGRT